jgi:soluble lytic murein transglycosylase
MQITPAVGRDWAAETGMRELERQMVQDPVRSLRDPERNIQIGCWYLEKFYEQYRDVPGAEARMIAAYNAGPSRAAEWNKVTAGRAELSGVEFINNIDIPSTRAYVVSILERYRKLKGGRAQELSTFQKSPSPDKPQ